MQEGIVNTEINDGIGIVSFYHPKGNSLSSQLLSVLTNTISQIGDDPNVKIIILKSEGDKVFCAGASFYELIQIEDEATAQSFFQGFGNLINAMKKCPKLIIGKIQGKAVGGGVGIIAATDYSFATGDAQIKLSELSIGIGPFVVGPAIQRKLGISAFSQITLNPDKWFSVNWLCEKGLFTEVVDSIDELDRKVLSFAQRLKPYSTDAMSEIKKMLWSDTDDWDELLKENAVISARLVLSEETKNALRKFNEARKR
ncbi:MAG: enoyl-CoA hydratase/isomerase family protein [Cyclobacteriaceae bacterium]